MLQVQRELAALKFIDDLSAHLKDAREPHKALRQALRDTHNFFQPAIGCVATLRPGHQTADLLFEHSLFNVHPKFWGYITGSPAPLGMLGDLLAAGINPNVGAFVLSPVATEMEKQTVRWIAEFIGFESSCGGTASRSTRSPANGLYRVTHARARA